MSTLDDAVIARLKRGGRFEILVDPDGALALKKGDEVNIEDILAVEDVFEDAHKGDRVAEEDLLKAFGTKDILDIAKNIIETGEIQLTTEQRRKIQEQKKKKVVDIIATNAINPQTNTPHPPSRIERAIDEAGVHIDIFKSSEDVVSEVMKKIRPLIPIRFEEVKIAVKVPADYAAKSYGDLRGFGQVVKEEWQNDGSWIGVIKIPAGLQDELYNLINHLTKGDAETRLLKEEI
ncbi:MAG: ribosome assembly factor SBDS [Halobacteriota archaeon]|nr:ribosome assembly factor SBDS [Halobacteriota archaeon]